MILPLFAVLDNDQKNVFSESPKNGSVLIVGPPGSGKTVVAMHRAIRLSDSGKVVLGMFNKTLRKYASEFEGKNDNIEVVHIHEWVAKWYENAFDKTHPTLRKKYDIDWETIASKIQTANPAQDKKLDWGHMIIDEGQDFPKEMYRAFAKLLRKPNNENLSLTVFADENQTITEKNSTIVDIMQELNVSSRDKRHWRLDKNYRNTLEIAQFSLHFQVLGTKSVTLPDEPGTQPVVFVHKELNDQLSQIIAFCGNMKNEEIGVVVLSSSKHTKQIYNKLKNQVNSANSNYLVQTYIGGKQGEKWGLDKWDDLIFDKAPSITVLHQVNTKGLEFDVVFVIRMDQLFLNEGAEIDSYKRLYVTCTRPRKQLFLMNIGTPVEGGGFVRATKFLPEPKKDLCKYFAVDEDVKEKLKEMLSEVEWLDSASGIVRKKWKPLAKKISKLNNEQIISLITKHAKKEFRLDDIEQLISDRINNGEDRELNILHTLVELSAKARKAIAQDMEP